ncbi:MAG: SDR family NAD(P)-dependent oxidoreductase [Thermoplasmatota archaeon]
MKDSRKICLITGASSGIGKNIAHEMVRRGWRVIAVARNKYKLDELAGLIGKDRFIPMVCDVGRFDDVKEISNEIKNRDLYPELFFLNAGDGDIENDEVLDWDLHRKIFDVNYFGTISWINQWLTPTKNRNGGIFVATSSLQSFRGMPGAAGYGASKSAISHCFESLDAMYHKDNIRFLVVYPGPVDTAMLKSDRPLPFTWKPEKAAKYIVKKVMKRITKIRFPFVWAMMVKMIGILPDEIYLRLFKMKSSKPVKY